AKRVLKSMETRKYNFTDQWFVTESCAVCLEEYIPGQEVRILPCRHEFHKSCVDGWLINRRTCPLCLSNIL
ncbi:hypothetical protein HELRODRAFT_153602, partial [Helobdella robusta]|uniref:RING-type domain-containing protein n=1 Tax=Helobdella robusta TaxID=6412 RepID=T1EL91_HELRO